MLEAMAAGLAANLQWPTILFPFLGALLGMLFGALPGLGGPTVIAVLVPITFGMDPGSAMVLLAASLGGVSFGASIPAILINTPGDSPNAATCFDGYPLARQGKAGLALGASAAASALGAAFGLVVLVALLPFARSIILAFSYPELFMLALMGISAIAVVTEGEVLKGLITGGVGLMIAMIGLNPINAAPRFTFQVPYLWDGIPLVPALIGLFAVTEALHLYAAGGSIADAGELKERARTIANPWAGVVEVFRHPGVFFRSSITGTIIGAVPGLGGTVANFLAYTQAVRAAKDPENFGKGDIRGVIASEASNDSKDGGALLPTLAFGIPGSASMVPLMGGFVIQGIAPGPRLMTERLDIVFALIFALLFSNIITSLIGLGIARYLSFVTLIPNVILSPIIIVIGVVGAYALNQSAVDAVVAVIFGFLGYLMALGGFPKVPLIIGMILGQLAERSFHFTLLAMGWTAFFTRPLSLILLLITVGVLVLPAISSRIKRLGGGVGA